MLTAWNFTSAPALSHCLQDNLQHICWKEVHLYQVAENPQTLGNSWSIWNQVMFFFPVMPGMFYYCTLDCRGLERRNAHYLMSIWGSSRLCCGKEDYSTLRKKPTSNTHRKVVKWVSKEVEKSSSWEALSNEKHWEMRLAGIKCSPHPLHKPCKSQHWGEQQQKNILPPKKPTKPTTNLKHRQDQNCIC